MKRFFTRLTKLVVFILLPGLLFAQNKDYNLILTAGKFVPAENAGSLSKSDAVFQQSLFNNKHYVTIQFTTLPNEAIKTRMRQAGIELVDYIPHMAYTAVVSKDINLSLLNSFAVRSIIQFTGAQKTVPDILNKKVPQHAIKSSGYADVDIVLYENLTADQIVASLNQLGATIVANVPSFKMFTVRIPSENLVLLVGLPFVQWTEYIAPPNVPENLPGRTLHRVNVLNDGVRNLKGDGMNIGVWDERASQHLDFSPAGRLTNVDPGASGSHGTHVSGTIGGRGLINPLARGMAPNANIFSYYGFSGDVQAIMATAIPANTLISSNHSYHDGLGVQCGLTGASASYSLRSRNTDINLNNNLYHLHCHSSGNNQTSCTGGWGTITGTGKSAKNNVVVGSVTTTEALSSFSSCGPVHDGRVKPEIVAMGSNVFSTYTPLNTYGTISGTSMSTPGITGTVALLAQRYKQLNGSALPPSALIKNIACNTATDLGNTGPDYRFGFGRINALAAVKILEESRYELNNVITGQTRDLTISVPAGASRLRVMLTWNDPAATANAAFALVNNLDLRVIQGATTYLPWILDPTNPSVAATTGDDNYSNIEQITVLNPPAGEYTLRVNGEAVPTGPNQVYALTWDLNTPYIEVIYPNGNEGFNPGATETITWDNSGLTGTQTVEYSINNGSTWNLISSSIPATTTRLTWSVPVANTSTAMIRVTSGAITDVSDVNFKILGTVTGFAVVAGGGCSLGEISFTWSAVANATHYDIYRLDPATGAFVILSSDITTTAHTATGLTAGANMWFYIVAKNNTTGSTSDRSIAINGTVSSGGGGLGAIGGVTGQNLVCGNPTGVPYSVAPVTGATTYTWSVPPGATIAGGQGTTSVTVNYGAGSTSGNVGVYASAGSCQTTTSTLSVTVASAVNPATSGGNQSQAVCPAAPIPTLTATATVPAGHTVVWYDAATGGSIVSSPTLSTVGTITYYAAAKNTASGCESATRVPVVLTITQVPAAAITAGGVTTFCQGGSVVLTANTGTSYLWSNGATTQSITATTSGSYTVQVTTGSCVSTSPATVVTVNPTPVANITANGATTFCQGLNVVLTASAGSSWLWSNGATTQSITVSTSGNYTVVVTSAGCSATSAATAVTVNPNPPAVVTAGGATTFCQGNSVILTANAGTSYLWSNGATTQSITVSGPVGTTSYTVAVTQSGGCVSNSPATAVTVNAVPPASITAAGATTFCQGGNVMLTASAGTSWLWSNGATTQSITVGSSGNYSVTVSSAGCSATSTATAVTVSPNPVVNISAAPYTNLFPGLSTTLTANVTPPGSYNYTWFKNGIAIAGATTNTLSGIDLADLGNYTVTVTNTTGLACSNTSPALAIGDSATTKLFIYPSPNNGSFSIAYYTTGTSAINKVVIFDSKGAMVYSRSYPISSPYQTMSVDMRRNSAGIYRVVLFDKAGKRLADGSVVIN